MAEFDIKRFLEVLPHLEVAYRRMQAYDEAPDLAVKLFSDLQTTDTVSKRTHELLDEDTDRSDHFKIMAASNYRAMELHFINGRPDEARTGINILADEELPIFLLGLFMGYSGRSYVDRCMQEGALLTPQRLDKLMFKECAPSSAVLARTYLDKPGLALVAPDGLTALMFYDRSTGKKVETKADDTVVSLLEPDITYETLVLSSNPERDLTQAFHNNNIRHYSIVEMQDKTFEKYMIPRYTVYRAGHFSHVLTPIRLPCEVDIVKYGEDQS